MTEAANQSNQVNLFKPIDVDKFRVEGNNIKEFTQLLKIQFVKDWSEAQVVFDRIHRKNKKQSKPLGYIRFDSALDCVKLSAMFLVSAAVLAGKQAKTPRGKGNVAVTALQFFYHQLEDQARILLREVLLKLKEGEK